MQHSTHWCCELLLVHKQLPAVLLLLTVTQTPLCQLRLLSGMAAVGCLKIFVLGGTYWLFIACCVADYESVLLVCSG
jgi:hypothetical protein